MTEGRIFDAEPHPDERVEWLRAQAEVYLNEVGSAVVDLVQFVRWMEKRFMPRGFFDR